VGRLWLVWLVILWCISFLFGFFVARTMGWEEITVWDHHDWSSSSEVSVIPYSKWDSQEGSSYGYVYDYRPQKNWIPPASRELERQEIERSEWWRKDYKNWLESQGVDRGMMIGW